jgi:hypothetical protein
MPYHKNLTCCGMEQRPRPLEWLFKNYDTGIDKGSEHTKQILAELIKPGGRTIHYIQLLIQFGMGKKTSKVETVDQHPYLTRRVTARV